MWWLYLYSRFNFITIILTLLQVIIVFSKEEILANKNLIVSTLPYLKSGNDFEVTTVYKFSNSLIKNKTGDGFNNEKFRSIYNGSYSIEIHSRTKTIGLKSLNTNLIDYLSDIVSNNKYLFQNNSFIKFSHDKHWKLNDITANGYYCDSDNHINFPDSGRSEECIDFTMISENGQKFSNSGGGVYDVIVNTQTAPVKKGFTNRSIPKRLRSKKVLRTDDNITNDCFKVFDYDHREIMNSNFPKIKILTIEWHQQTHLNSLRITYLFNENLYFDIAFTIYDVNDNELYTSTLSYERNVTQLMIKSIQFNNPEKYKIIFYKKGNPLNTYINNMTPFSIFQIANYFQPSDNGCGPNSYGADCSGLCSILTKGCRGMYFCTNRYGCTCPVGLTGPFCDEDCAPYSYGANCNQYCSRNCFNNTCDQYTGICSQGCLQGYLPPNCIEKYTAYLLNSPKLISATPDSIIIEINFELENIKDINEHVNVTYYQLLWKASNEDTFTYADGKLFNCNNKTVDTLSDLKSDTTYTIGVLLIMEDGNYDNQSIVFGQYKTKCHNPSLSQSNIKVREEIKSINITWDKISFSGLECKITKFVISLYMNKYEKNNSTYIYDEIPYSKYSYCIHDVIPGNEYTIKVTPMTINGDLSSFTYFVKPKITNEDLKIKDITAKTTKQNSNINLSWKCVNKIDLNDNIVNVPVTYIVKYKINRIFSCSLEIVEDHWTFIKVDNSTNYEILDAIPNTQYMIQVTIDSKNDNAVARKNTIYVLTPALLPTLEPVLSIEHPVYITNNSITIDWEMNHTQCSKINGFFLNYVIEFRESNENITIIKETKQNYICLEELKPSTHYEIKVFIKNHVGYNSKYFLLYNFKTKYDLAPVDDLIIYKKSSKNRMLGLRWRYFDTEHLDKFVISLYDDISKNLKNETVIPPVACLAWPDFYCYTFHDIHFNNNHSIKVKAKSLEYPEGGKTSSVSCNSVDGIPDSPSNVKAIEIGKTNLTIQWDIPWMFNGELKSFILNIEETSSVDIQTCCESIMPVEIPFRDEQPNYTYTFNDLRPGSTYSIGVLSKSSWYGSPSRIEVTTLI